jgi:WD40 repeat protein
MKFLFVTVLTLLSFSMFAQNIPCDDYPRLMKEAQQAFDNNEFEKSILKYNSARSCAPNKSKIIDGKILEVFAHIEKLKARAEENARIAKTNAKKAKTAQLKFENMAKASELAGLAYNLAKANPTHALRVAEYAVNLNSESKSSIQQQHDIISAYPSNHFTSVMKHDDLVNSIAFSPDEKHLLSGCWDNKARLWSLNGTLEMTFEGHKEPVVDVAFSPDGKSLLTASLDNTIKMWNREGKELHTFTGHHGDVVDIEYSPDGQKIVSASWDGTIKLWTVSGKEISSMKIHDDYLTSVAFSPDGRTIATGSMDKTAKIWNLEGTLLTTIDAHKQSVTNVQFSPEGNHFLTASWDGQILLWDLDGNLIQAIEANDKGVGAAIFSPNGKNILSSGIGNTVKLWDLNGKLIQEYNYHKAVVSVLCFSDSGNYFASGSGDKNAVIWNNNGTLINSVKRDSVSEATALDVSNHGTLMLAGYKDGALELRNLTTNSTQILSGHTGHILDVAITGDGNNFVSCGMDGKAILWNLAGDSLAVFKGHDEAPITSISFFNHEKLIVSGDWFGISKIWNFQGEEVGILKQHKQRIYDISVSPDDKSILTSSRDRTARIWNRKGETLVKMDLSRKRAKSISYSPDGNSILISTHEREISIWDTEGNKKTSFSGHGASINSVGFSPDGNYIFSGSADNTVKIWNLEGKEVQTLSGHSKGINAVATSPDGKYYYTASDDGTILSHMSWKGYLNSEKLYELNPEEKKNYGLDYDAEEYQNFTAAKSSKKAGFHPEPYILSYEKSIQGVENLRYYFSVSMQYMQKSCRAADPKEKEALSKEAIERMEYAYKDKDKTDILTSQYSLLAFYYGNLSIAQIANDTPQDALKSIDNCLSLESEEFVKSWMKGKRSLIYLLNNQKEKAFTELEACKTINLSDHKNFSGLYRQMTTFKPEENTTVAALILKDIEYLEANGITHPDLEEFKTMLETKP